MKPEDGTEKEADVKPAEEIADVAPETPAKENEEASSEVNTTEMPAIEFSSSEDSVSYFIGNFSDDYLERTLTTIAQL